MTTMTTLADDIKGVVVDKHSREPLIGATVMVGNKGAVTDTEGRFAIQGLKKGKYTVDIQYVGYKKLQLKDVKAVDGKASEGMTIEMDSNEQTLREVQVTGMARHNQRFGCLSLYHCHLQQHHRHWSETTERREL